MNNWQEQALLHAKKTLPNESCGLVIDKDGVKEYFLIFWDHNNISNS